MGILNKIFKSYSDKELKRIMPIVDKIETLDSQYEKYSDEELRNNTSLFKQRLEKGETLDDILPEAFATVREAAKRVINMKHFRVQLIGGIILHQGRIAEMRTGEGKTLVATLPSYLNALEGKGVTVVTVNDYLAKRDSEWMGKVHEFLGLTVGTILHDMDNTQRRYNYSCDITYATNNELGFDYLRDNMVVYKQDMVQRGLHYAIIDEIDSILIDEARTPLIISGSGNKSTKLYNVADGFVKTLSNGKILNENDALNPIVRSDIEEEGDFIVDEKAKAVSLTQEGIAKAEKYFVLENLSDPENMQILHHINNALKANYNMSRDKDYVVSDNEIIIVDEFTGRLMPGRRYSDGLHQSIEAKENVKVNRESKTLATITFQNFFNKYTKKSGMTGTALTEEGEFRAIYAMDVISVPTNRPLIRTDLPDLVYKNESAKFRAVVDDIVESNKTGQPVLVGTVTIDKSEQLSHMLKAKGISHTVLNAKYHEQEAEIVAKAGKRDSVTIATNMAGRGTDIILEDGVSELGGLKVIGTERHESRRIDNQLRGRSGRQGDPGVSRFYISLEDDLMRLFGSDRIIKVVDAMGLEDDDPIEHSMLTKAIENAQKKVEANNFAVRKHLLDFDQVMNEQREIIYKERMKVLLGENLKDEILEMLKSMLEYTVNIYCLTDKYSDTWDIKGINDNLNVIYHSQAVVQDEDMQDMLTKDSLLNILYEKAVEVYAIREAEITSDRLREIERSILLRVIDSKWTDHIDDIDQMRQGINLRAYAQKDPLLEYKFISFGMFEELTRNIQHETVKILFNLTILTEAERRTSVMGDAASALDPGVKRQPKVNSGDKVGRNDPCPCGSGKKYKNCCGKNLS